VIEVKETDWDRMTPAAVRRNVRRQIRQIWDYIESQRAEGKEISPGVVFPRRPADMERLHLIERMFEDELIAVVWNDESVQERKARS
jgi:hypothetical protein